MIAAAFQQVLQDLNEVAHNAEALAAPLKTADEKSVQQLTDILNNEMQPFAQALTEVFSES